VTFQKQGFDRDTLQFYDANAASYSSARPDETSPDLIAFLPNLAPGSRILELGCGSGGDAAEMLRQGFDVDATDGTPAMAELASKRIGRHAQVLRFDELDVTAQVTTPVASRGNRIKNRYSLSINRM